MEGLTARNSTEESQVENSINILFIVIKAVVSLLIILANTLNLIVLPKLSDIKEVSKIFHLALSITDLIIGIVVAITIVYDIVRVTELGRPLCITMGIVIAAAPFISVGILVLLHLDRFLSITKPLRYPAWITPRIAQAEVIFVCVSITGVVLIGIGLSPSSWDIIHYPGAFTICMADFSNSEFAPYGVAIMVCGIDLPAVLLVAMYFRIICISLKARGYMRRLANIAPVMANESQFGSAQEAHSGNNALIPRRSKIEIISRALRPFKMPFIITFVFFFSWGPFSILFCYVMLTGIPYPVWMGNFGSTLVCLNSFWNTVLYMMMKKSFREKCWTILNDFRYCRRF